MYSMVTIVNDTEFYHCNLMKVLTGKERKLVMDAFINSLRELFHDVNIYQTTTMCNLNILQFCHLYFHKVCGRKKNLNYI